MALRRNIRLFGKKNATKLISQTSQDHRSQRIKKVIHDEIDYPIRSKKALKMGEVDPLILKQSRNIRKVQFFHKDLEKCDLVDMKYTDRNNHKSDFSHIYMFDKVFSESTLVHVAHLLNQIDWKLLISCQTAEKWKRYGLENFSQM